MLSVWVIELRGSERYWRKTGRAEVHGDTISFTLDSMPLQRFEISKDQPQPPNNGGSHGRKKT
jgi:hypothetical protein